MASHQVRSVIYGLVKTAEAAEDTKVYNRPGFLPALGATLGGLVGAGGTLALHKMDNIPATAKDYVNRATSAALVGALAGHQLDRRRLREQTREGSNAGLGTAMARTLTAVPMLLSHLNDTQNDALTNNAHLGMPELLGDAAASALTYRYGAGLLGGGIGHLAKVRDRVLATRGEEAYGE